ncbi:MAG: PBP1A family penicillin-binding protein [Alphaproteobacteria bacterium]|nr:PBP1A family penicillin-binding protein [Alphaproteobacteria bacterium]MCB9928733.1 PBP1A family penicillin-binding protein [Alphaproteobacteria bacterium]
MSRKRRPPPTIEMPGGGPPPRRHPVRRLVRWALRWTLIGGFWAAGFGLLALGWFAYDLPDVSKATHLPRAPSLTFEARDGSFLAAVGDLYGQPVRLSDLPPYLPQAFVAIEDRRFYDHWGVDLLGIARAFYVNLVAGEVRQGGSTITQQVAKNLFLTNERSLRRKIQETLLALWLEYRFSKGEILETYLNRAYFGAGAYGVDAAARRYFGKSAREVSLWQAAVLAGLVKAPSHLSPLMDSTAAENRAVVVLDAMVNARLLSPDDHRRAVLTAQPIEPDRSGHAIGGRYFIDWVLDQVQTYLPTIDRDLLIRTTLDRAMQDNADALVKAQLILRPSTAKAWPGQAALLAMSPDGAVRAMVGGRDYQESQFNRATQARRQPGSVFKTFTFLAALEAGYTPESHVTDAPLQSGEYRPDNYNSRYYGDVTLETALAKSLNSVTVRLADQVGYPKVREMAQRLGIASPLTERPSLVLGASGVRLTELTAAYAVLANGGEPVTPYGIVEIRDRQGRVIYPPAGSRPAQLPKLLTADVIGQANRMLSAVLTEGTGHRAAFGRPAAGKTGTTQGYRDAWFVGYTPDLVASVWTGNDDNSPVDGMTGGNLPASLWGAFMRAALADVPATPLPVVQRAPTRPRVDGTSSPSARDTGRNRGTPGPLGTTIRRDFSASERQDP